MVIADAIAGYTVFIPNGRYTDGADNNTGIGMWGHELQFGSTVYLNEACQYHAAALFSFDFNSKKEDSETKVGNVMNIEGGVGGDFLQGGLREVYARTTTQGSTMTIMATFLVPPIKLPTK